MSLSPQAKLLIKKLGIYKKGKHFFRFFEELSHDGYDSEGPKSNIWTLFIYDINNKSVQRYDREYWFRGSDIEEYQLGHNYTLEEFRNSSFGKSIRFLI